MAVVEEEDVVAAVAGDVAVEDVVAVEEDVVVEDVPPVVDAPHALPQPRVLNKPHVPPVAVRHLHAVVALQRPPVAVVRNRVVALAVAPHPPPR